MKIAVLCSGNGSNLQAIIDAIGSGSLKVTIALVVADNPKAYALTRAKNAQIETLVLKAEGFSSREAYDKELAERIRSKGVGLVVLAGFMRLMSAYFIREFKDKILNIHPSLLPSFKGTHGIRDALAYGVKVTGPTVHFVDEELDHGPIVLQSAVEVRDDDTEETLLERVHRAEHSLYPEAIRLFAEGRLKIEGRKVRKT